MAKCIAVMLHFRNVAMSVRCVGSLVSEGVDALVIVDNSEDDGVSVRELKQELEGASIRVDYIEPGRNLGFSRGVNEAVRLILLRDRDVDVLLINSDATLIPRTVQHLLQAVSGTSPVVAAPSIDGPTGLVPARTFYRHLTATISPAGHGWRGHALLGGACLMIHRELVVAPLFDESFFFYGDDIEFGYRMTRRGVPLVDVPAGVVVHQGSGSSHNGSLFYEYHMSRAHLVLTVKLGYGVAGCVLLAVSRMLFLVLRAAVRSVRFGSLRPWRGLAMAISDLARGKLRTLTPPAERLGS